MEFTAFQKHCYLNDITASHPFAGDESEGHENDEDCTCEYCIARDVVLEVWQELERQSQQPNL